MSKKKTTNIKFIKISTTTRTGISLGGYTPASELNKYYFFLITFFRCRFPNYDFIDKKKRIKRVKILVFIIRYREFLNGQLENLHILFLKKKKHVNKNPD